jgi:fumarylacetoacetate (FAA) hydrolase
MKLATYRDGSRDGQLVVVSRDLGTAHYATGIAAGCSRCWTTGTSCRPQLQDLYDELNQGKARHAFPFDPASAWRRCRAPTSGPTARPT